MLYYNWKGDGNLEVDILVDSITDCLIERETGNIVETEYREKMTSLSQKERQNWKFDWSKPAKSGFSVFELFVKGDDDVQGRIALKIDGGVAEVDIVETAPHNFGHDGKYKGVGGHLFAIACKCSLDAGCDGVVAFTSKSALVDYYKKELNAVEIMPRRLVIFEEAAQILLEKYIKE